MTFGEYVVSRWDTLSLAAVEHALVVALAIAIATAVGVGIGLLTYERPKARGASLTVSAGDPHGPLPGPAHPAHPDHRARLGVHPVRAHRVRAPADHPEHRHRAERRGRRHRGGRARDGHERRPRCCCGCRLPLAWPLILTGVRVSAQMLIGIAAIAAYVDGPGLGNQIFEGLSRLGSVNSLNATLAGTLGIVIIAVLFDAVLLRRPPSDHAEGASCSTVTRRRPHRAAGADQALPGAARPSGRQRHPRHPGRRARRLRRPVRLRQDDHDEDDQPAGRAHVRRDPHRRPGRPQPATPTSCAGTSATPSSRSASSRT